MGINTMIRRIIMKRRKTLSLLFIRTEPNSRPKPPIIQTFDPNLWVLYQTRSSSKVHGVRMPI